ncbi:hypothetical protein GMJLKIPL_0644 [Methylobacterium isbiliense]|uniref:Uncharacterized protein n=2 Tax=Methylobacterium TaxID=407 RepID=A0ABQ4SAB4_9HYPH|nr:hypothetical protein GMJLKIPL_0644 [Methylobacterium isbiliense]
MVVVMVVAPAVVARPVVMMVVAPVMTVAPAMAMMVMTPAMMMVTMSSPLGLLHGGRCVLRGKADGGPERHGLGGAGGHRSGEGKGGQERKGALQHGSLLNPVQVPQA